MSLPGHFSRWSSQLQLNIAWNRCRCEFRITLSCLDSSEQLKISLFFALSQVFLFLSVSSFRSFLFHSLVVVVFVLRAVNKMHKHTYREYLCKCVFRYSWTVTLLYVCGLLVNAIERNSAWCASPNQTSQLARLPAEAKLFDRRSLRFVPLSGSSLAVARRDDRIAQLVSTSEKIVITSSFIIGSCRQTGYAEALPSKGGSSSVCSGVTVNLV